MSDKIVVPLGTLYPNTVTTTISGNTISNQYPIWWEDTITLYNRYEDKQTNLITWYKTVLTNCFWKATGNKVSVGSVEIDTKALICRIPKSDKYLSIPEWEELPNDEMSDYFTLRQGDIVVKGEVEDDINEYQSGYRSSDFIEKYRAYGCFQINHIGINTGSGKCLEHYYISGE